VTSAFAIETTDLRKAYGKTYALAGLDLQVGHGERDPGNAGLGRGQLERGV